jgi:Tol biopolymer transport system component
MNADGSGQTRLTNNTREDERPAWSPDGTKLAFASDRDGNYEIYVMNADGSGQTRLTDNPHADIEPAWSPDGTKLSFVSARDGIHEIYVMNPDGSGQTRLTNNAADDVNPAWSPDGTKIAFASNRHGGAHEIYVMNADGSGPIRLTNNTSFDLRPAWSPDGTKLAFQSEPEGGGEIYVMNADGSAQTNLTNNSAFDAYPAWQPIPAPAPATNGKLAFGSDRDGNFEIYVMNPDGSGQSRLTSNPARDAEPTWSPNGTKLAFRSDRDGNDEIYVMNADGSAQVNLTNSPGVDGQPAWSPDGTKIAFASTALDGNRDVYVMNADGSGQNRLTNDPAIDIEPAWSPDGAKLAFRSHRDGNGDIYVMNSDGSGQTRLTTDAAAELEPAWSPDGAKVAFASDRDGNAEMYVMNADGSGQTRLTNNPDFDGEPAWSTDGTKLAFRSHRDGNAEIYVMNADGSGQTRLTSNPATDYRVAWQPLPTAQPQTITFTSTAPSDAVYNGPTYTVAASATSGLAVTFGSSTPAVCTVSGSTVSFVGVGTCIVTADQAGNANYAAAPQVTQSFAVSQASQTITFTSSPPSDAVYNGPTYTVAATATSGLAVTFGSSTPAVCSVSGSTVSFVGVGTCTVTADQAGNANYAAAPQVTQSFAVSQATQTIMFTSTPPSDAVYKGQTYTVAASATSGVAVTFGSSTPGVCTMSGSTVSFVGVGTCTVTADQAGNANYAAAPQVTQSFAVGPATQTITFTSAPPNPAYIGGSYAVAAIGGGSGNPIVFSSLTQGVCTVAGSTVSLVAVGTCTVAADQGGNPNYAAAPQVTQSFSVVFVFTGFFQPVDNPPTVNRAKAGRPIPVRFSLGGYQGLDVFAAGYPISGPLTCDSSQPLDDIEQTVTAGGSSLSYDAATDTYMYVWKTDKAWANSCRRLTVRLSDGTDHWADFRFTK